MSLTLHRGHEHRGRRSAGRALPAAAAPVGVLVASVGLAAGFVLAVSDLVTRLG
jgi:hypothetical protein